MADIISSLKTRLMRFPIHNGGQPLIDGTILRKGDTAETNLGVAIKVSATSNVDTLGVLREPHIPAITGDALVDGSVRWFAPAGESVNKYPSRLVEIGDGATLARVDVDLSSTIAVGSYSNGTISITGLESGINTGFVYVASGTGAGQLRFIRSSAAGSCAVAQLFTTALDTTSMIVKILPLFHRFVVWTAADGNNPTKIGTTAAAGTGRVNILERHIIRNGTDEMLDPVSHSLDGLNNVSYLSMYYVLQLVNTAFHPID